MAMVKRGDLYRAIGEGLTGETPDAVGEDSWGQVTIPFSSTTLPFITTNMHQGIEPASGYWPEWHKWDSRVPEGVHSFSRVGENFAFPLHYVINNAVCF